MQTEFVALVPVKRLDEAKSRLLGVSPAERRALALAFAVDTLAAVRSAVAIGSVVVVTPDDVVAAEAEALGCTVAVELGELNAALRETALRHDGHAVAVCADLPALTTGDLDDALAEVRPGRAAYVADRQGTGTTLYAAPVGAFEPRFGVGSARAHADGGAVPVSGALQTLRHDVDTADDLAALARTGALGTRTRAAMHAIRRPLTRQTS